MSAERFIRLLLFDLDGHTLARYRPLFMMMEAMLFAIAGTFWIVTDHAPEVFAAQTWGAFAWQFPAQMWATLLMLASFATFFGLVRPPARRLIYLGLGLHVVNYSALAGSAALTGGDLAVALYAVFFATVHAILGVLTARRGWGDDFSD